MLFSSTNSFPDLGKICVFVVISLGDAEFFIIGLLFFFDGFVSLLFERQWILILLLGLIIITIAHFIPVVIKCFLSSFMWIYEQNVSELAAIVPA
jgi:hypothetical protein